MADVRVTGANEIIIAEDPPSMRVTGANEVIIAHDPPSIRVSGALLIIIADVYSPRMFYRGMMLQGA